MKVLWQSLRIYLVLTLLTGILYPSAMTGVAQLLFPKRANGSPCRCTASSSAPNCSPRNLNPRAISGPVPRRPISRLFLPGRATKVRLRRRSEKIRSRSGRAQFGAEAPVDLLTASGSGLDPHISPEAARFQVARVAAARGSPGESAKQVDDSIEPPQFGFLGEPRVNVLQLNLALDHS